MEGSLIFVEKGLSHSVRLFKIAEGGQLLSLAQLDQIGSQGHRYPCSCSIDERAAIDIQSRVEAATRSGARVLCGHVRKGALYTPTVLDHVHPDMEVVKLETFGPVAPVIRFSTIEEAIHLANGSEFGLSSAVCTDRWDYIHRFVQELEVGSVNVREIPGFRLECTPFGGIKNSGLGYKEGVIEAMRSFTNVKTYSLPWSGRPAA